MEYSGIMDGCGDDLDISREIQVKTTQRQAVPGLGPPPASSSTPAKKSRGRTHLCTSCGNSYKHLQNLRRHVRAIHEHQFQCVVCKKTLVSQVALESHMNGHEKKKPFSCAACKKTYQSRNSLAAHSCTSKPPSWKCTECPKACPSKKALKQHILMHEIMPQFFCHFCGLDFKHRQSRNRHVKSRCMVASAENQEKVE